MAAAGWTATRSLKLARFGDNMRFVAVTEGDKTEVEAVFGVQVNTWGVNDPTQEVAAVSSEDVDELVTEYQDTYDVATELQTGKERHQSLRDGAAIELGLRSFLAAAASARSRPTSRTRGALKQLTGLAVQRLMEDGYGFGAEGDWKTAVPDLEQAEDGDSPTVDRQPGGPGPARVLGRPRARRGRGAHRRTGPLPTGRLRWNAAYYRLARGI